MSKYKLGVFPQDQYRFRIFDNTAKLKDWPEIMTAAGPDCVAAMNLAYFALSAVPAQGISAFDHQSAIMVAGKWGHEPAYHEYGICINADGRLTLGTEADAVYDYAVALPPAVIGGRDYNTSTFARNGVTYLGLRSDDTVVVLISVKDQGMTSAEAVAAMRQAGCVHILRWDGSWSSRGCLGPGQALTPSQYRLVRSWLLIYKRGDEPQKEDKPVGNYIVTAEVGLNIRSAPAKNAPKMGGYSHGAVVTVLELRDGWARTDRGWVYAAYLRPVSQEADRTTDNGITIQRDYIAKGRKNRPGGVNSRRYITIHETGNKAATADAAAHGTYLKSDSAEAGQVSWHYTVDDHAIVQHLPDGETAYHAGDGADGPGNTTSIGVEICVNAGGDFEASKRNTAALVRLLMGEYGIPLYYVVQHNRWNGKDCPRTIRETVGGWEAFLALCGREKPDQIVGTPAADWAVAAWGKAKSKGVLDGTRPTDPATRQELAVVLDRLNLI
ncbi:MULTISPECIES: N-acetylmuramoyl-L-alanine amidase [Intestinimonas]|uniref:N-acetylmuramoyl-L-alanine amidase n=1 Tax=Intestinimonas TaxID=1392389 RepID=UPI0032EC7581